MNIYENRNNKRSIQCGYCYHEGHNKRHCPHLKAHYQANKDWNRYSATPPVGVSADMFPVPYQRFWSDNRAIDCFRNHFDYAKGVHGEKPTTGVRPRRKSKCGFCGDEGHNRRNCFAMREFVKVLEETNQAYRELFYDHVIDGLGLGVGAFVEYGQSGYNGTLHPDSIHQGLITTFDLDTIGIGNTFGTWSDYKTTIHLEMNGESRTRTRHDGFLTVDLCTEHQFPETLKVSVEWWSIAISKVIAPAPTKPSKEWFLGQSPAFDWVVRKKSLKDLWQQYWSTIKLYHPDGDELYTKWYALTYRS